MKFLESCVWARQGRAASLKVRAVAAIKDILKFALDLKYDRWVNGEELDIMYYSKQLNCYKEEDICKMFLLKAGRKEKNKETTHKNKQNK